MEVGDTVRLMAVSLTGYGYPGRRVVRRQINKTGIIVGTNRIGTAANVSFIGYDPPLIYTIWLHDLEAVI